jgi:hypothetical protein
MANIVIDTGTTSASGDMSNGVLGCYNPTVSPTEITLIQGWNWYAGANATQIGSNQYDFQTTVSHELGHALGLGGSSSLTSPMNESLPTGVARRVMTVADLNIPYPPEGPDPQTAAGLPSGHTTSLATQNAYAAPASAQSFAAVGLTFASPKGIAAAHTSTLVQPRADSRSGPEHTFVFQGADRNDYDCFLATKPGAGRIVDSVLTELVSDTVVSRGVQTSLCANPRTMTVAGLPSGGAEHNGNQRAGSQVAPVAMKRAWPHESTQWLKAPKAGLTDILLSAGFCASAASALGHRHRQARVAYRGKRSFMLVAAR